MTSLPRVPPEALEAIAANLSITQLVGGTTSPWVVNDEQRQTWQSLYQHQRNFITKSRRRGVSTALDLRRVIWTLTCDAAGHRVRAGVVMHVEDKLVERFVQMSSFLHQLGMSARCLDTSVTFPNGSEIFGMTAGGKGASRSEGAQDMTYEEYSFYQQGAVGEISPSVSLETQETICTTIDIGAPNGARARDMWRADNGYQKLFFPFEMAAEYRTRADRITDEQWAWAQKQGFKVREAAAYWLAEVVPNKCEGDTMRAFREYPPTAEHMFMASAARWVNSTPKVLKPVDVHTVMGVSGTDWKALIYIKPEDCTAEPLIGVDTAEGKGQDRSVVAVVDRVSRRLCAVFVSDRAMGDDVAKVAHYLWAHYSKPRPDGELWRPRVVVEDNTTGGIVIQPCYRLGLPIETFDTTEVTRYNGLLEAKRAVEMGYLEGPAELAEECDELHRDEVTGKWKGRKDILMAYGFCAVRIAEQPPKIGPEYKRFDEKRVDGARIIRNLQRQQRGRWY